MRRDWRLSEELYRAMHQWPKILLFVLAGALLGWLASYLWPASYRAKAEIYIGLNPYRSYNDSQFLALSRPKYSNIDDYKNWQMTQLSAAIFLDEIVEKTLRQLQRENDYWNKFDPGEFRSLLNAEWRTSGVWSLTAQAEGADLANQAAQLWSRNAMTRAKEAVAQSQVAILLDEELQATVADQTNARVRKQEFQYTQSLIQNWIAAAENLPAEQPLELSERWELLHSVTRLAQFSPAWLDLLAGAPGENDLPQDYVAWLEKIQIAIDEELRSLNDRLSYLEGERTRLETEFGQQQEASLGLSPNLSIRGLENYSPEMIRPAGTMILIGALLSLLAWAGLVTYEITQAKLKP